MFLSKRYVLAVFALGFSFPVAVQPQLLRGHDDIHEALDVRKLGTSSTVNIVTPDGETESFTVKDSDTIEDLKSLIKKRLGVPPEEQELNYKGNLLSNGMETFRDLKIPGYSCENAWAYDTSKETGTICLEENGYGEFGWSNGQYGASDCDACNCSSCRDDKKKPTKPPSGSATPPKFRRELVLETKDSCECICPVEGSNKDVGLSPVSLELFKSSGEGCGPAGDKVGNVYLSPNADGSKATVSYETVGNFTLQSTNLFVGQEEIPPTPPEKFQYKHDEGSTLAQSKSKTHEVDLASCNFYVAAQAEVCSQFNTIELTVDNSPLKDEINKLIPPPPIELAEGSLRNHQPNENNKPVPPPPIELAEGSLRNQLDPGSFGDPHFVMWTGHKFDFHGGCDLVLIDQPDFNNGQGLRINIRTKVLRFWSFVDSAVVQIGNDTLEVKGGFEDRQFWVNGQRGERIQMATKLMPFTIGGFKVRFRVLKNHISFQFKILLNEEESIVLRAMKDFMKVDIQHATKETFRRSQGMMGSFDKGEMLGRDGITILENPIDFGLEWQVRQDEPMLFHSMEGVQHPDQCEIPNLSQTNKRRLEGSMSRGAAVEACDGVPESGMLECIFDVLATNDVGIADAYGIVWASFTDDIYG